jgi:broad specificity phosphatase PhoE
MQHLILIRHTQSQQDPSRPASQWGLTEVGRRRCAALADRLAGYAPARVITSAEPKAAETGALAAARLGLPHAVAAGLHEHLRERTGWLAPDAFERTVAALFERPTELVWGEETAAQAGARFGAAVQGLLAHHPGETLAIVTHGTVMTLFIAKHAGIAPIPFWRRLGMPAFAVLSLPDFGLLEVAERVEG